MSYEIKNIIHSCHANIEFLKDIEQYIREQADTLSHEEKEYIKNSIINKKQMILELKTTIKEYENKENKAEYSPYITKYMVDIQKYEDEIKELEQEEPYYFKITINDKQGKEIIKSFHKMSRSTFENEVHTIEIQASSKYQNSDFRINIDFSDKKDKSYTSIKTTGDSAKVTATGITQELKKRTLEYTNHHNLFYGSHNYILYILALVGANAYVILDEIYIRTYYYIYIAFLGILLIYIILRSISPYCTIPTQKNENRNKFKKWLFGIGISFLLSIGLFYFKSNVLGQEVKNERDKDSNLTTR